MKLDHYKQGTLTDEELETLTGELLRASFNRNRRKRWTTLLQEQYQVSENAPPLPSKTINKRVLMWVGAIAAAILLLFVSTLALRNFTSPSYEQLADVYMEETFFINPNITKGDEDHRQLKLDAIYAYNEHDFAKAIQYYENLIEQGQTEDGNYFYLALSYLYNQQHTKAIEKLVLLDGNDRFQEEQQWFLALAYLKADQVDMAKNTLSQIKPNMWNYNKAQKLLEKIK